MTSDKKERGNRNLVSQSPSPIKVKVVLAVVAAVIIVINNKMQNIVIELSLFIMRQTGGFGD